MWTDFAVRTIDPFLVRASHHFLGHQYRVHLVASKEYGNFLKYSRIVADIAVLGEPPA